MKDFQTYRFIFLESESAERFVEWETENFEPTVNEIVIEAASVEEAVQQMKQSCQHFSNQDWDWEYNEQSGYGRFSFGNDMDGLQVLYEFERVQL